MSRKLYLHQVTNKVETIQDESLSFFPIRFQRGHIEKITLDQYNSMNSKDRGSFRYYANKQQIEIEFLKS